MPVFHDPLFPQPGETPARRRSPQAPNAVVPVPLRTPLSEIEAPAAATETVSPVRTYEAYNPYPPRVRTGQRRAFTSSWPEIALVALLAFAGLAFMSTFFIQKFAEKQVMKALIKVVAPLHETATFTFGRVNVGLFKGSLQIRNIEMTLEASGETIHIDRVAVWGLDRTSMKQMLLTRKPVLPETVKMSVDGARLPMAMLGPRGEAMLAAIGYESLSLSTYVSVHFDRLRREFTLENLHLAAPKVGQVDLSFALGNVTLPTGAELAMIKKDPRKILGADFSKVTIKDFEIAFVDDSVTNRVIDALRLIPGETSPLTLVEMAMAMNGGLRGPAAANVDFVKPALAKLHDFLLHPTSLTLSAHPSAAIPLMSLLDEKSGGSINELAHKLNMRVD